MLLLVAANALLLSYGQGWLDPLLGARAEGEGEPERLQRQVNPELVRVIPPRQAASALAAAAASSAASAAEASAASAAPEAAACMEAPPIAATELAAAEKALRAAGLPAGVWSVLRSEHKGVFLIYMGRYPDEDAQQKKFDELKRLKVSAEIVRSSPDLQPGLSLGRFDDKAKAEADLAQLVQRGVRTARVITLRPPQTQLTLRVPAADASQRAALAALKLPGSGAGFAACVAAPAEPASEASPKS